MNILELLKEKMVYIGTAILGAVAIVSYTVAPMLEDGGNKVFDEENFEEKEAPKEISNQIDENSQKLDAMAASNDNNNTDYRILGC